MEVGDRGGVASSLQWINNFQAMITYAKTITIFIFYFYSWWYIKIGVHIWSPTVAIDKAYQNFLARLNVSQSWVHYVSIPSVLGKVHFVVFYSLVVIAEEEKVGDSHAKE